MIMNLGNISLFFLIGTVGIYCAYCNILLLLFKYCVLYRVSKKYGIGLFLQIRTLLQNVLGESFLLIVFHFLTYYYQFCMSASFSDNVFFAFFKNENQTTIYGFLLLMQIINNGHVHHHIVQNCILLSRLSSFRLWKRCTFLGLYLFILFRLFFTFFMKKRQYCSHFVHLMSVTLIGRKRPNRSGSLDSSWPNDD